MGLLGHMRFCQSIRGKVSGEYSGSLRTHGACMLVGSIWALSRSVPPIIGSCGREGGYSHSPHRHTGLPQHYQPPGHSAYSHQWKMQFRLLFAWQFQRILPGSFGMSNRWWQSSFGENKSVRGVPRFSRPTSCYCIYIALLGNKGA